MTKLINLPGAENLPKKNWLPLELLHTSLEIHRKEVDIAPALNSFRNGTIEEIEQCGIVLDEETTYEVINNWIPDMTKAAKLGIVKALASQPEKFIKIVKE